ncbi:MAG TPA: alginate lyase family protein [Spirillospora sp.]|nr:alginate lyase family protein [Spirillospora sp.]
MFQPQHYGLYFTDESVQRARKQRDQEPFRSAWTLLRQRKPLDLLALAQHQGLLYRFDGDDEAGARAVRILEQDSPAPSQAAGFVEAAATVMTWAQCFEMVRDHPTFSQPGEWMRQFASAVDDLNQPGHDLLFDEQVWLNALNLVASIVLEQEASFKQAANQFREIVRQDIHPEGYLRRAAVGPAGESLKRMLLAAQALILTAEAATHAGENLWAFNERGVSALTSAPYLLYYYYYPEKWRWDSKPEGDTIPVEGESHLTIEAVQELYQRHAGLWEMAQHQSWSKDRETLLAAIRPVYDLWGGGLVTLTHGTTEARRKRFGLF